jgi:hypothetical protein
MMYKLKCPGIGPITAPLDLSSSTWMTTGPPKPFPDPGLTGLTGHFKEADGSLYTWSLDALDQ